MIPRDLGPAVLDKLADLLDKGRMDAPYTADRLGRHVAAQMKGAVVDTLAGLAQAGMAPRQIAVVLRLVAAERRENQRLRDGVELVWSGPEVAGSVSRDTGVVVRDLFRTARRSVLISNYAFDRPTTAEARERARAIFAPLAENLDRTPALRVRMFVNVARPHPSQPGASKPDAVLLRDFAEGFLADLWPGGRQPEVFYDPRALLPWEGPRASLHAKCVVVDEERLLLTSANFTQAAQVRNIEAGLLLHNPFVARSLREQFESLVQKGALMRLPGVG